MNTSPLIFDRNRVRLHKNRAAQQGGDDFLLREMIVRGSERLAELNKTFDIALELGAHGGTFLKEGQTPPIKTLIQMDMSEGMIRNATGLKMVAEEDCLPVKPNSVDLCISFGSMQWINDLPGSLVQVNHALKAGGLLLAMLPGGQSLTELRQSFEQAEMEISGGVSPRISPFIDAKDAASLLSRAGFCDPVVDSETLTLQYDHPLKLLKELRAMGESNALIHSRKNFTPVSIIMLMADIYMREFMNDEGRIPATIELVTMTAWKSEN